MAKLARDIMTRDPACCSPRTTVDEVAKMMVDNDCGEIPVIDGSNQPIGVVTDRDIVCRLLAAGKNPLDYNAERCMSTPVIAVRESTPLEKCAQIMEESQIRRVPVVDGGGMVCGIVSQADIAKHASRRITAELVRDVSQPATLPH